MNKVILVTFITFLVLAFVILSMGGGHGFFWPAKLIYPYAMILAVLNNQIGISAIIVAVIQIPLYAVLSNKKSKWLFLILGIHMIAAIICLNLPTETFSG